MTEEKNLFSKLHKLIKTLIYLQTILSYCLKCRKNTESENPKKNPKK